MIPGPNRRWFRFSLATLLILTAIVGLALAYFANSPRRRYEAIEIGMPLEKVEAILGSPGQELSPLTYIDVEVNEQADRLIESWPHTQRDWIFGSHMVSITLGSDRRVVAKYYKRSPDSGAISRLLDRTGL